MKRYKNVQFAKSEEQAGLSTENYGGMRARPWQRVAAVGVLHMGLWSPAWNAPSSGGWCHNTIGIC